MDGGRALERWGRTWRVLLDLNRTQDTRTLEVNLKMDGLDLELRKLSGVVCPKRGSGKVT